ncbi:DUF3536 domain-containing protein [Desulfoplanes formicivorans]|uniref:Glycoside hydrolase family 57 N-terminal domain-containing protein n=1 Tax=Desulfoplanes formicivorans TaxID=1592317 RepID=A0A194AFI9_9BACT|nr:DUF3536 domain-containing protein [Desulfoplanes formicivorans]GAU07965.1 hypothetical protein DPF_0664 [Desulfoplanes formicivorans]
MSGYVCIHGHCYQPPRLDPWVEEFLAEPSAAPYLNWNERIAKECYSPLAWARRMEQGKVVEIINCYEWISFNFGPTLLTWMERHAPQTYARILQGDARSQARLGHGNALAQVYHHAIMPLSTDSDKDIEIAWAIQDFEARFQRRPEGMWLAETAVDTPTLEALARAGIGFTILAPHQAKAVATLDGKHVFGVDETTLDTSAPYRVNLPSGNSMVVFFYNGPLSRAVAFEQLLADGESFFRRIVSQAGAGLCSLATDGESYGHHFTFGEMALAYAIHRLRTDPKGYGLTNYAAWLENHPPSQSVILHEPSSWSCIHGVERWKSDCGCTDGGHPQWKQHWRQPLRRSLNYLRYYVEDHYRRKARPLFHDHAAALKDYGLVLAGKQDRASFLEEQCTPRGREQEELCLSLLTMQRWSLASFASCAWFFDDLGRIEPVIVLTCALRSLEVLLATGGRDVSPGFLEILEEAQSNDPSKGDGVAIWKNLVVPRRMDPLHLAGMLLVLGSKRLEWPGVEAFLVNRRDDQNGFTASLSVTWQRTGTRQKRSLGGTCGTGEQVFSIDDGQATYVVPRDMHAQVRGYLTWQRTSEFEAGERQRLVEMADQWSWLVQPFGEGQTSPLGHPGAIVPGVAWLWIRGDVVCSDAQKQWMRRFFAENMHAVAQVGSLLTSQVRTLLDKTPLPGTIILDMIERARAIGVEPYWWNVQNAIWTGRDRQEILVIAKAVGMVIEGES